MEPPKRANLEKLSGKINGNLQILHILKEILRFFPTFFNCYRIFRENLGRNLEICICSGFGGGSPRSHGIY